MVVTLLGISCWVGETEIKDKLRIRAGWHQRSTCLGTGNDDWEGLTAHYCLGRHIGNGTGQPRGVGKLTRTLTREDRVLDLTG